LKWICPFYRGNPSPRPTWSVLKKTVEWFAWIANLHDMRHLRVLRAVVLFGCAWLQAQPPMPVPPVTLVGATTIIPSTVEPPVSSAAVAPTPLMVINDPRWNDPTAIDVTRPRSARPTAGLSSVSIRAVAGDGANSLIAGAMVQGSGTLPMLVRAIGPGLANFGITNWLRHPTLEIYRGDSLSARTNTLGTGVTAASPYVGAFAPLESSAGGAASDVGLVGQAAGGALTAICSAAPNEPGVALVELYDATAAPTATSARVVSLSGRARVAAGEELIVVGFVVTGEGYVQLLLRGVGPTLAQFGVADFLPDPTIALYAGNTLIAANDNWRDGDANAAGRLQDAARSVGDFDLASANDAALLVTLPAGTYTLQVRGAAGQSGVALAEIYQVASDDFDAASATNTVGLDLYRQLAPANPGQNLIISPYSIESALSLAYAGADGVTRSEMAQTLRLPSDNARLQSGFAALRTALQLSADQSIAPANARTQAGLPTDAIAWQMANRLFGQQGYAFRDSFLTLMQDGFAAPFQALDFLTDAESARLTINAWVEYQTRQKILDLIPAGGVNRTTRLVLVNALYLKASWATQFGRPATVPRAFYFTPDSSSDVPTMQLTTDLGYATADGFTVVALDYLGGGLQFVIVLPDASQTVDTVAARLTPAHFAQWANLKKDSTKNVALYLPKFKVAGGSIPLGPALRALGMKSAFDVPAGSANFSGIAPRQSNDYLAISDVFHQTYVAVDEEGTEAAAATAVVMASVTSVTITDPPIEVHVDRPFLFVIQDRASGACLFLGRITNPQ
jgi:serpin B